jgi:hypothetical protein
MLNYLKVTAFMFIALTITPVHAHQVNFNLAPKVSKLIENKYLWSLNATCTIQCNQAKNKIMVRVVKNKGVVNGRNLSDGQMTSVVVHNHDSITVSAEPGAQVNLLNLGTEAVQATCST